MELPPLCIDARAASDLSYRGIASQEHLDLLLKEPPPENTPLVVIAHPEQAFQGAVARWNTNREMSRNAFAALWERGFVGARGAAAYHSFRAIDQPRPRLAWPSVTTWVPASAGLPARVAVHDNEWSVVPAEGDARVLRERYEFDPRRIEIIRPTVRSFFAETAAPRTIPEASLTFLCGARTDSEETQRIVELMSARFPQLGARTIFLKEKNDFSPAAWARQLASTRLLVYLTHRPFDWPVLALEALAWNIPVVYPDRHSALDELLPQSPLKLSRFLVELPTPAAMKDMAATARQALVDNGSLDPQSSARAYRDLYGRVLSNA